MANDSLDFVQRGKVSIVRRQYAEAVKICRLGLLAHPTLLEGRLVLGMALTALERWDEVLAEMRVALETDPHSALAWLLRGEALVGKGDYAQADSTLKRAKELDPSNTKADQLLAEIEIARAAGLDGAPAEQTDTKVYPAKLSESAALDLASGLARGERGEVTGVGSDGDSQTGLTYDDDEATEVDPDPAQRVRRLQALAGQLQVPAKPSSAPSGQNIADDEERSTETFLPPGAETSYEGPAPDDYAESARPRVPSLSEDSGVQPTPIEVRRSVGLAKEIESASIPNRGGTDPAIELTSGDISIVDPLGKKLAPIDEDEEADTRQRRRRLREQGGGNLGDEDEDDVGTRPETPDLLRHRQPPAVMVPKRAEPPSRDSDEDSSDEDSSGGLYSQSPTVPAPKKQRRANPFDLPLGAQPGREPSREIDPLSTLVPDSSRRSALSRVAGALDLDRLRSGGIGLLVAAFLAVVAVGVVAGLVVREWRMGSRVRRRYELARQKLASGNYPGFLSAELLYRQILTERDDPPARALRARTLAQMAFEFGDPTDAASRAVAGLGDAKGEDADEARVYLALAKGETDRALRDASALMRKYADPPTTYLYGRAELLLDRPQAAVDALRRVTDLDPRDALVQHALGVAEAALKHDDRALEAYRRALDANSNHLATIIDRALLQVRRGSPQDRDAAKGALGGVVEKLAQDCSPGQLARAHLGLGELELARGDLEAARRQLAFAVEKRRDGDVTLDEDLARDFMRAFALDEAELEAKRAMAGSPRIGPRLVLAEVALRRGRPQQAVDVIDVEGATRPDGLVVRALAHLALGHKDAARIDAEAALRVQPDSIGAKIALARVEVAEGHADRAQRDLERLERAEKTADVSTALGLVYAAEKLPDRAVTSLREAIARDPLSQEARLSLAAMLREGGRYDEAADELKQLLLYNPNYRPARAESARLAQMRGEAAVARDHWDALAKEDPDAESLLGGARAHLSLGDPAGAEERVLKAQKLDGADPDQVSELLARAWLAERRPAEVVTMLRKGPPGNLRGPLLPLLMNAYLDLDQPERAREVLSLSPPRARYSTEAVVARSRLAIERGRDLTAESLATTALVHLRAAGSAAPLKSVALLVLGRSQWEQGDFRPALRALSSAEQLDPQNARAFYYQAMVDYDLRRADDARRALETSVQIDSRFPEAQYYLARSRAEAGDPRPADAYRAYLALAPKGPFADEANQALNAPPKGAAAPAPRPRPRPRPKPIVAPAKPAAPKAAAAKPAATTKPAATAKPAAATAKPVAAPPTKKK